MDLSSGTCFLKCEGWMMSFYMVARREFTYYLSMTDDKTWLFFTLSDIVWWYDFGIFLLRLTMRFGYFLCVLGIVYVALLVFVKDTSYTISIMDRPRRVIKLTEPGRELLERNLRGKCGSALKAANVVANKLSVLLQNADNHDVRRVEGLYDELKCNVANVLAHQSEYEQKFAGDMDVLASFVDWFQPRFKVLQDIVTYTPDCLINLTVLYLVSRQLLVTMT